MVRSGLALLTLLLIGALSLVAPTVCAGCRVDLHDGQAFHVVFAHVHPDAPVEVDGLVLVAGSQPELHAAASAMPGGESGLVGQVLPRGELLAVAAGESEPFTDSDMRLPPGLSAPVADPPPRLV